MSRQRARAGGLAVAARLTRAEREVLALAVEGLGVAEIARQRGRDITTVGNQLRVALAKERVIAAERRGLATGNGGKR